MKKIITLIIALLTIGAVVYWQTLNKTKDELTKVRVGHLVALDMAPLFVAKEAGYFKEEGLNVETVFFANPGDNNGALASGDIQFSTNPFTLPFLGDNSGVPMKIISSAGGLGIIQVVIQGKYNIDTVTKLNQYIHNNSNKRLKVGTLRGDTLDMILYKSFNENNMSYDNFEMVWFNDLLAMVEAFKNQQIDILSHIKPYTTDLELNYNAKVLTDNSKVWGEGTPNCTVAVLNDYLNNNPKEVKSYLKALHKGFELIVKNPEKATELLINGKYYNVSKEVLLFAFKNQPKEVILQPNKEGMMMAINDMISQGYIKSVNQNVFKTELLTEVENQIKN